MYSLLYNEHIKVIITEGGNPMAMENNIKLFRAKMGYTQEDLAQKVNVTRQTIISLEKGSYTPSLELAFKLSDVFQVPIEEIFYRTEDKK
jgi:putative transcriptional regulator